MVFFFVLSNNRTESRFVRSADDVGGGGVGCKSLTFFNGDGGIGFNHVFLLNFSAGRRGWSSDLEGCFGRRDDLSLVVATDTFFDDPLVAVLAGFTETSDLAKCTLDVSIKSAFIGFFTLRLDSLHGVTGIFFCARRITFERSLITDFFSLLSSSPLLILLVHFFRAISSACAPLIKET